MPDYYRKTAREHAREASRLLQDIAIAEFELAQRHSDEITRLHDGVSGVTAAFDRGQERRRIIAEAHALCAIALHLTEHDE